MSRPTVHTVAGGYCRECGELESWLAASGAVVVAACGVTLLAGHSTALDCIKPLDHAGEHRSFGGSTWG